jgi:hypothetical protein
VLRDCIALGVLPLLALSVLGGGGLSGCTSDPLDISCPDVDVGDLVVTEIHGPQSGEDGYGEWIEIYNSSSRPIDLTGLAVSVTRLDGSAEAKFLVRSRATVEPDGYAVFGKQIAGDEPAHVDYGYISDLESKLYDSGAVEVKSCGMRIDLMVYRNLPTKGSVILDGTISPPTAAANDDEMNLCLDQTEDAMTELSGIRGTPKEGNPVCPE